MNLARFVVKAYLANLKQAIRTLIPDNNLAGNRQFHLKHRGESCFILGSGHSVSRMDLKKLQGRIVMTQNHFHAHPDIQIISPMYHVLVPKYQPEEYDDTWNEWLSGMDRQLPSSTQFFMAENTRYLVDEGFPGLASRTHYLNFGFEAMMMSEARIKLTEPLMYVPTVITQCISIALYMGFSKIYLVGFDLDQVCHCDRDKVRFYGNSPITANQSERDYENRSNPVGETWFNLWNTWHQLNLLKTKGEKNKQSIINLTDGGLLDVFSRQSYSEGVG